MRLLDPAALALLVAANSTPVIVARMLGPAGAAPIDALFRRHGGHPIFGSHKTWRGLASGALASLLAGALLPCGAFIGLAFGLLSLTGDLASSFSKRRLRVPAGHDVFLLDQLPETLLPLIVLAGPLGLTPSSAAGAAIAFVLLDLLSARWRESVARRATRARAPDRDRPAPPRTH